MNAPGATIFIVDDDPAVRSALSLLVHTCGWKAKPFASAEEVLGRYARERPACLLLDLEMDGMSGVDLQRLLNTLDADLPVIVISAYWDHPLADQAREAGARKVLGKPVRDTELVDAIDDAIGV